MKTETTAGIPCWEMGKELKIGDRVLVYDEDKKLMFGGDIAIVVEKLKIGGEWNYGLYIEGETIPKYSSHPLIGKPKYLGQSAIHAPFFAEQLLKVNTRPTPSETIKRADIEALMKLQQKYDNLLSDCKDLFNVILNLAEGNGEMRVVQFYNPDGYPSICLDYIRKYSILGKESKPKTPKKTSKGSKNP